MTVQTPVQADTQDALSWLSEYYTNGSETTLKKACSQIIDVCKNVYSATSSERERDIYANMIRRLSEHLDKHSID